MKTKLIKNTLRGISRTMARFLSILAIIAIGCAFFSGLKASAGYMKDSADKYLKARNTADFCIKSTIGFSEDDISAMSALTSADIIEKGFSLDVIAKRENENIVISVRSLNSDNKLNSLVLESGRMPENKNECVADYNAYRCKEFTIGETVSLYSADDISELIDNTEYKIVGLVRSPLHLSDERGSSTVGNGVINGYIYVPEENFISDRYTDVYISANSLDEFNTFSDDYDSQTDKILDEYESFADDRVEISKNEFREELEAEIQKNKEKLSDAQKEYNDGKKAYDDAVKQIDSGKAELNAKKQDLENAQKEYEKSLENFDKSQDSLNALLDSCKKIDGYIDRYNEIYVDTIPNDTLDDLKAIQSSYDEFDITFNIRDLLAVYIITDPKDSSEKYEAKRQLSSVNEQVRSKAGQIAVSLEDTSAILTETEKKISDGKDELEKYEDELDSSEEKLLETSHDLEKAKKEIDDAQKELDNTQSEIDTAIADAKWYVLSREGFITAFESYGPDCDRIDNVSAIFPIFFILIGALVCICTMTRMIEEQRTEAGTFKALGIGGGEIISQYVIYAAAASVFGSVIGVCAGLPSIPRAIQYAYASMYDIPGFETPFKPRYLIGCLVVSLMCTALSAFIACKNELKANPAELMRPKPPRAGKRIFLENIRFIWTKLSFTFKVTFRNLFRYKSRFFMSVLGIAGSTALLLTGFGLRYEISAIVDRQFGGIMKYDAAVVIDTDKSAEELEKAYSSIRSQECVSGSIKVFISYETAKSDFDEIENCSVLAPEDINLLGDFITLRERRSGLKLYIPENGAVINEKLASLLNISVGDKISVGENGVYVNIIGITENYVDNYIYVSMDTALDILGENTENTVLLNLKDGFDRNALSEEILKNDAVLAVNYTEDGIDKFSALIESLNLIVILIIGFSGALALVILINLAAININERTHELATLKVIGFYDSEVSSYLYRENIFSTLIGMVIGLLTGIYLLRIVVYFAEASTVMFAKEIPAYCFGLAALITASFALVVSIATHFRITRIEMASSLKAIE